MIQFYTSNDTDERKAYNVYRALVEPFRLSVASFFQNADIDPNIGAVMYNNNVIPFAVVVQPSLFSHVWGFLVNMIIDWGAFQVLDFIISVYGVNVDLNVEPPMNIGIKVNVGPEYTDNSYWIGGKPRFIKNGDQSYIVSKIQSDYFYMIFKRSLGDVLSQQQLEFLLKHLRPAGERWQIVYDKRR